MAESAEERRMRLRRDDDLSLAEWRGNVNQRMSYYDQRFLQVESDIREQKDTMARQGSSMVDLHGQVMEARSDVGDAVNELNRRRQEDIESLRQTIIQRSNSPTSSRVVMLSLLYPIVVLVIGGLLIAALTGHIH